MIRLYKCLDGTNKNLQLIFILFHKCLLHSDNQEYKHEFDYTEMSEMCSTHCKVHSL